MSDYERIKAMLKEFCIDYTEFDDAEYICEDAILAGVVRSISIRDRVDLGFCSDNKMVGSWGDQIGSWERRPENTERYVLEI